KESRNQGQEKKVNFLLQSDNYQNCRTALITVTGLTMSNDGEAGDMTFGPAVSPSVKITREGRERMERNRLEAKKRLLEKSGAVQEVLAAYKIMSEMDNPSVSQPKKSRRDQMLENDLQNAVSKGTVVRVQGTKLIDTGGGFLLEEKDLAFPEEEDINVVREPAAIIPTDVPTCEECEKTFFESFLLKNYGHPVCDGCKDLDEKHTFITRTDAKNEFLLKDVDLDKREPILKFILRPNPHNPRWGDMKLYLRLQVEKRALEVWESIEKIQEQHEVREENRAKGKIKKFGKKMKNLRMAARSSLYTRDLGSHEHIWGEESYNDDDDNYSHTCTQCGQVENYEKM
ncbi:unnamed protein product, partial [Allacma fusca]